MLQGEVQACEQIDAGQEPVLNRTQIAQIFGVSENTIDKWRAKGMPVETEGGNGRAYEFLFSVCKEWREKELAAEKADRSRADQFVAQQRMSFLGVETGNEKASLSPAQLRDLSQAEILWMKAARERRALVAVEEVSDLLDAVFSEVREGLDSLPDWLEREFALTGEQVVTVVNYTDQVLKGMKARIEDAHLVESVSRREDEDGLF
jgi:phage terminase Nu1 subunit (DNA packaging protein)